MLSTPGYLFANDSADTMLALDIVGDAGPSIGLVHHVVGLEAPGGRGDIYVTFAWIFGWLVMVFSFVLPRYGCRITILYVPGGMSPISNWSS